jgi:hypothetical protein
MCSGQLRLSPPYEVDASILASAVGEGVLEAHVY